jgi:hypothetical protein
MLSKNHQTTQIIQQIVINTYLPHNFSKKNIIKIFKKMIINVPLFLEIHGPWNFENSWSMNFLKFMVHQLFGIQCPKDFCDFGLFNRLAQAGRGGPYYMIFHYQKHTVLNYLRTHTEKQDWNTDDFYIRLL